MPTPPAGSEPSGSSDRPAVRLSTGREVKIVKIIAPNSHIEMSPVSRVSQIRIRPVDVLGSIGRPTLPGAAPGLAVDARALRPMLARLGLTYPPYLVMVLLWEEGEATVGPPAQGRGLAAALDVPEWSRTTSTPTIGNAVPS